MGLIILAVIIGGLYAGVKCFNHFALEPFISPRSQHLPPSQKFYLVDFLCLVAMIQIPFAIIGGSFFNTNNYVFGPVLGVSAAILFLANWLRSTAILTANGISQSTRRAVFILVAFPLAWLGGATAFYLVMFLLGPLPLHELRPLRSPPIVILAAVVLPIAFVLVLWLSKWVFQPIELEDTNEYHDGEASSSSAPGS